MQVLHSFDALLVESICTGGSVEVQISTEDLVASFSTQDHLDTHSLDLAAQEVHGCARTDSGDVVRLEVMYDVWDGIQTLLDGEDVLVVHCAEVVRGFAGGEQVRRVLEAYGEGVQLRPGGDRC